MSYVTVGRENTAAIRIYYEDHGQGAPVVLVHGYLLDGRAWLYLGLLMMIISIRGTAAAGNEASLTWLMPRAEARLRHWLAETATAGDTGDRS